MPKHDVPEVRVVPEVPKVVVPVRARGAALPEAPKHEVPEVSKLYAGAILLVVVCIVNLIIGVI